LLKKSFWAAKGRFGAQRVFGNSICGTGSARPVKIKFEKRLGSATTLYGTVPLSFVIPRGCDFIGFAKKLMLKTNSLSASKIAKNQ
jgi:hypothetical protein